MSLTHSVRISRRHMLAGVGVTGLGVALLPPGMGAVSAQDASPGPDADYPEFGITAADYHLELPAASIPGGFTKVTLKNEGSRSHHAMFLKLNDGVTVDDFNVALESPDLGAIFSLATSLGGPEVDTGRTASVILDLPAGRYVVFCLIPEGDDATPHYMLGMHTPLEVTEAVERPAPTADGLVEMVDFGFGDMPMETTPGVHTWEVTNVGEQLHQFLVHRQADGVTFADVEAILAAEATPATPTDAAAPEGPPPFVMVGGAAPMSPGAVNYSILELEAGNYFAICFIPDPASGAPHFAIGMLMPFTVA